MGVSWGFLPLPLLHPIPDGNNRFPGCSGWRQVTALCTLIQRGRVKCQRVWTIWWFLQDSHIQSPRPPTVILLLPSLPLNLLYPESLQYLLLWEEGCISQLCVCCLSEIHYNRKDSWFSPCEMKLSDSPVGNGAFCKLEMIGDRQFHVVQTNM